MSVCIAFNVLASVSEVCVSEVAQNAAHVAGVGKTRVLRGSLNICSVRVTHGASYIRSLQDEYFPCLCRIRHCDACSPIAGNTNSPPLLKAFPAATLAILPGAV